MSISDWLQSRYRGKEQSAGEIEAFVHAVTNGSVSSAQLGAWLAFVLCKGMSERETVALTKSMVASGKSLQEMPKATNINGGQVYKNSGFFIVDSHDLTAEY